MAPISDDVMPRGDRAEAIERSSDRDLIDLLVEIRNAAHASGSDLVPPVDSSFISYVRAQIEAGTPLNAAQRRKVDELVDRLSNPPPRSLPTMRLLDP